MSREGGCTTWFAWDRLGLHLLPWYDYRLAKVSFYLQKYPSWDNRLYSHSRQEDCPGDTEICTMAGGGAWGRPDSKVTEV